jgi:ribonuclease HI
MPPKGESFKYFLQMHFPTSNSASEYEALLHGLRIATALGIHRLKVLGDSLLIVNQANKEWSCLDNKILLYCQELLKLETILMVSSTCISCKEKMRSWMS